ncbi:uncharacterized protein ACDP82_002140 [Pangshura tecta]
MGLKIGQPYRHLLKVLERHHQHCLRKILKIKWEDRRTNISVLEEAKIASIEAMIIHQQFRRTGYIVRMPDHRLPELVLLAQLKEGYRNVGGQWKRYKDLLKDNLKKCNTDIDTWETRAQDRLKWSEVLRDGPLHFKFAHRQAKEDKRCRRKERLVSSHGQQPLAEPENICPHCNSTCGSRIGLINHLRTHMEDDDTQ